MEDALSLTITRERPRLRNFIRRRVTDWSEAEDVLQDVFAELVAAYDALEFIERPIEQVGAWLFRVARNRTTDLFRKRRPEVSLNEPLPGDGEGRVLSELLPSADESPEAAYARGVLAEQLEAAIDELPEAQRAVFLAHEVEGISFSEIAAATGVNLNTLLARKRYAVKHLRRRLRTIHEEFGG